MAPSPPMPCSPHTYSLSNFYSATLCSHLYVLGGSLFDARSFPLDRPLPSSSAFRFDFATFSWTKVAPMISPRGSFACAADCDCGRIFVAGGGSRHAMFGAAGSRMSSVEMYDVERDEWVALEGLPRFRAGCVGFLVGKEFWVMGGYGEARTVSGVFPMDEYYRDGLVMKLMDGCWKWREIGDMWREGERRREAPGIVMLDERCFKVLFKILKLDGYVENSLWHTIFDWYNISSNRWFMESSVPRKSHLDSIGFVALDGELHVMSLLNTACMIDARKSRQHKRGLPLLIQIYDPNKRKWRSLTTRPPFSDTLDFKTAVMCTVRLQ
ncbi:hypothetical protein Scep_024231 [Stephania cephalantha]|uniref:Uncharacterized protein n=1 Tax=Stephania cephalantha TaxID=152367 RepID=A0AAP0HY29_9MAGN